ncbi:uncharacterized protein MONBRDRAFT_30743 [Monosiga brevicollis MX1]|uniref:Enhancer of polycomb-like protein n=1 Tax=Monosiga brevicollis TaxID=81824 RepID=A9UNY1_MONBE|nr:uncharacterized protein MONBRDRAFT_30743 [Monosiga brevicollis MX1]EDQ92323.1 predicted protein [Monosiga brevicollis MX1]|eukprot:XP_001742085.1 hypothetical protein [Monosiga brevicollis MX1]
MSKFTFRTKALEPSKPLAVIRADQEPEVLTETVNVNRATQQLPTGMEKEEEEEIHVKKIIDEQNLKGTLASHSLAIPIPDVVKGVPLYEELYKPDYVVPSRYVHSDLFGDLDEQPPQYDMDSDDETWLNEYNDNKPTVKKLDPFRFEAYMDLVEQNWPISASAVAKLAPHDFDAALLEIVHKYYADRVKTLGRDTISPRLKSDLGDAASAADPYVAFRRRVEKMQTRKNRQNTEIHYIHMLKLHRDLTKARELFQTMLERERLKLKFIQSDLDVFKARVLVSDWDGAKEQKCTPWTAPPPPPPQPATPATQTPGRPAETPVGTKAPKSIKIKLDPKRRTKPADRANRGPARLAAKRKKLEEEYCDTSAVTEDEYDHSDPFRFRRRARLLYHQPLSRPSMQQFYTGRYHYVARGALDLSPPREEVGFDYTPPPLSGYCRRRVGRGGRIIVDRLHPSFDFFGDLEPFTQEQLQDAADSDVPQQLVNWRMPRPPLATGLSLPTSHALRTSEMPPVFPAAGTEFGDQVHGASNGLTSGPESLFGSRRMSSASNASDTPRRLSKGLSPLAPPRGSSGWRSVREEPVSAASVTHGSPSS